MWLIFASQAFGLYCNHFGAAKNQSFWNRPNCGKSQPIRTKFGTHLYSVAYHHFPNLCAGLFGGKWGIARTSAAEAEVFLVTKTRWLFGNLPAADFHQIWPRNVNPYPIDEFWFGFFLKIFSLILGSFPPQNLNWRGSNMHLLLRPAYSPHTAEIAYCWLHVVTQGHSEVGQLRCRSQSSPIFAFCIFRPNIQNA